MALEDSILKSTKKILGIAPEVEVFDLDVLTHINSTFFTLNQLGVGPIEGFMIEDDTALWSEYLMGDTNLNAVRTYMFLQVRLLFDPPVSSYALAALEKQILEHQWRLNVKREGEEWAAPVEVPIIVDGGEG